MKALLKILGQNQPLSEEQTFELFELLIGSAAADSVSDAAIGAYLFATAIRLPTVDELTGAARALRRHMIPVHPETPLQLLDICGTGGTGHDTFNTSTVSAIVAAAGGQPVAKHGNRGVTSRCGSADLLSALGIAIESGPDVAVRMLDEVGFAFLFAPAYHPATKRVALIRRDLGLRTIFNLIGPLCNPTLPVYQLIGVSDARLLPLISETLRRLGSLRALVVHGEGGLDELSLAGPTAVYELKEGAIRSYSIEPESCGLRRQPLTSFAGGSPDQSARRATAVLRGEDSAYLDLVLLNAGAAFYVSGHVPTIPDGVALARKTIGSGAALSLLKRLKQY